MITLKLRGYCRITYKVSFTRDEAIEWLVDGGEAEDEVKGLSDADLMAKMTDTDEVRWQLDDIAVEVDASPTEWEVDA